LEPSGSFSELLSHGEVAPRRRSWPTARRGKAESRRRSLGTRQTCGASAVWGAARGGSQSPCRRGDTARDVTMQGDGHWYRGIRLLSEMERSI
ncbi:unnamed protein product, partial [Gulo gulo]